MVKASPKAGWEFDRFRLVPAQRLLLRDGSPVPLPSKAFDTLAFLIENRHRVVTKDELLGAVWPDVVVEEGNLTQQIFVLRKALGENAQQPRLIVTVPGHGYRFMAHIVEVPSGAADNEVVATGRPTRILARHAGRWIALTVAAGLLVTATLLLAGMWSRRLVPRYLDPATLRVTKLTESGKATNTAISPDGRYVAYTESEGDQHSIWVKDIVAGGTAQVVPRQTQVLVHLTFSTDGRFLYFTRGKLKAGGFALYRIPSLGGPETPILDDVDTPLSFSPDGSRFVFMRGGAHYRIVVADADGGQQHVLADRTSPTPFTYVAPAWSPDGSTIAAVTADYRGLSRWSIVLLSAGNGTSREIFSSEHPIGRLRWVPDGSGLLTVVSETLDRQQPRAGGALTHISGGSLWFIGYPDGRADRLTFDLSDYDPCCLDIAADGKSIVNVLNTLVSDLWIAPAESLDKPRQITWSTPVWRRHSWLPDNDTIVYGDLRGSLKGVRKDGRAYDLALPSNIRVGGGVSACGDGRYLVFEGVPGNNVWRIRPDVGGASKVTGDYLDASPACSADGKWIVYTSRRTDLPTLWRVSIEGGKSIELVATETVEALPSPSGRFIYYASYEWEQSPVPLRRLRWNVISAIDGKRVFARDRPDDATLGVFPVWAPDESGLDYVVTRGGVSNVWRVPLGDGPSVQITQFRAGKIFSIAWSPDGRWLSLASGMNRSDAVLISGRR